MYSKVSQLYIYIHPLFYRFFPHIGHYRVLRSVPCATQQVLMSHLFYKDINIWGHFFTWKVNLTGYAKFTRELPWWHIPHEKWDEGRRAPSQALAESIVFEPKVIWASPGKAPGFWPVCCLYGFCDGRCISVEFPKEAEISPRGIFYCKQGSGLLGFLERCEKILKQY